ncbi:lipoprotein signal peptide [Gilliamella sp. wkB178]|nr:lipoprotein signal peptide [Gilliamella apicola]
MKLLLLFNTLIFCFPLVTYASFYVGFKEINLDDEGGRPLNIAVWYPAEHVGKTIVLEENAVFYGQEVIANSKPLLSGNKYPLIVFSHGYGGSWRNLSWLAYELTSQGYIVAAPNHPGTTFLNRDLKQATQLWQRPRDLSRTIDAISLDQDLASYIDMNKIAAVGHSLGGWTVIALAGGRFNTAQFKQDCMTHSKLKACQVVTELGLDNPELNMSMIDPRIKAIITLDAGLVRGFTAESLQKIDIPSLVIGAGIDVGDMAVELESGYLQQFLTKPLSTYVVIPNAMHFSFIQECKPGAVALLNKESEGDGIICQDGGTRERAEIHRELSYLIIGFLATTMMSIIN